MVVRTIGMGVRTLRISRRLSAGALSTAFHDSDPMPESSASIKPPLILVASDDEWSARSFESILGAHGHVALRTSSGRQTIELSRTTQPSAYVIELRLPDIDGVEVCRRLRDERIASASTPIIITAAGAIGHTERLEACKAGAWDVCTHPLDATILMIRLETFLKARREVEQLVDGGLVDSTTGLYNARGLARRAREIGAEAQRRRAPLACIAFSLESDDGPMDPEGNAEIAYVANHLSDVFKRTGRVSDAIGRLGHAEFAIVAPATESVGAIRLAERVQASLLSEPPSLHGHKYRVRVRAGYAAVTDFAESSLDAVELLMRASAALRHGRARNSSESIVAFQQLSSGTLPA